MEERRGGRRGDGDGDGSIADRDVPLCRMLMLVYGGQQVVALALACCLLLAIHIYYFGPSWQRFAPVDLFNNGNGLSHPIEMFFPLGLKIS